MDQLEFFVGVDWGSRDHQVCVVDMKGKVCAQRSFKHCGMGLTEMVDWIVRTTQSSPYKVGVAIETPRGPVVESLMGREFVVYSINPKQLDRYRDRFSLAGAYSDKNEQLFQIVNFDEKYTDSDNLNTDSDNLNTDSNNLNSDSDNLNSDSNQNER